jgi:hypothetical protein
VFNEQYPLEMVVHDGVEPEIGKGNRKRPNIDVFFETARVL